MRWGGNKSSFECGSLLKVVSGLCLFILFSLMSVTVQAQSTLAVDPSFGCCPSTCSFPQYCDIGSAITAATSGDTINVAAATYNESVSISSKNLTIVGADEATTIVSAASLSQRALILDSTTTTISNMTFQDGECFVSTGAGINIDGAPSSGSTIVLSDVTVKDSTCTDGMPGGAGIYISNPDTLTATDLTVTGNVTIGSAQGGGGIYNSGTFDCTDCAISNNDFSPFMGGAGAGLYNEGTATLRNTNVDTNSVNMVSVDGGGIYNSGSLTMTGGSLNGNCPTNACERGGGLFNDNNATATLSGIECNSNNSSGSTFGEGGCFYNGSGSNGTLSIQSSTIVSNTAQRGGGGANNAGNLTVNNSTFDGNTSSNGGGGLLNENSNCASCTAQITNSTFSNNNAEVLAGGILNSGSQADLELSNVTVSGNTADGDGGGLATSNSALSTVLNNVTVTDNETRDFGANGGAGIFIDASSVTFAVSNSIIAQNRNTRTGVDSDCVDPGSQLESDGYNLLGVDDQCPGFTETGDQVGTLAGPLDPLVDPLADNGGETETHALTVGSPAIDTGDNGSCETMDQRGFWRPIDGDSDSSYICDMGAYELGASLVPPMWCGDGTVDAGEECDNGPANSDTEPDACRTDCTNFTCGDDIKDSDEACDGDQGCSDACAFIYCGNDVLDPNETCDDGNTDNGDGCDNNCTPTACGNGIKTNDEDCDDGNTEDADGCNASCQNESDNTGLAENDSEEIEGWAAGGGCARPNASRLVAQGAKVPSGIWFFGTTIGLLGIRRRRP